ncbi:TPA: DUF4238 domain-containing protein [Vibrio vulnificus]|nr:DUF4238 domain-containing protein [Vibrio vulnificus]
MTDFSMITDVKKQHTVPRFLLHNFSHGSKKIKQLYTFDIETNRVFKQSERDATTRKKFYNFDADVEGASLEPMFGVIESDVAPIFESIISNQSLRHLERHQREVVSVFVIAQRARTFGALQQFESLAQTIFSKGDIGEYKVQNDYLISVVQQLELTKYILDKEWVLYSSDIETPFLISDHPVVFHNHNESQGRGNLGLDVEGIQIHMPLTPTLSIGFLCPTVSGQFRSAAKQIMDLKVTNPALLSQLQNPDSIVEIADHINNGTPYKLPKQSVDFQNSLQVSFAEQYIFSSVNDFSLVRTMVSSAPERRKPSSRFQ